MTVILYSGLSPVIRSVLIMSICLPVFVLIFLHPPDHMLSLYFKAVFLIEHSSIEHCKKAKVVPDRDKGDSQEKAEASTKFCNQGGDGVNQLLRRNSCVFRHRPE